MLHYRIVRFQRRTIIEMLGYEETLTQEERLRKHRELEEILPLAEAEMRRLETVRSPALAGSVDSCYEHNRWAGWYGVEAHEPVPVSECTRRGDWTFIRIGAHGCCRVRTEDITVEDFNSFRARSNQSLFVPVPLADGPMADTLLDPAQSFFRRPDESTFWELITADSLRPAAWWVYAKWLEAHGDPHAWVFREPAPFVVGSVRFDWTEAMARVNCGTAERRPTLWEFARITGRGAAVPFTLSDGSPLPQFIAYLLGVTRIRADQRLSEADRRLLSDPVRVLGLNLMTDLLFDRHGDLICRVTNPRDTIDYLSRVTGRLPQPTTTELALHLREINRPPRDEAADEQRCFRCVQFRRPALLELAPVEEFVPAEPHSAEIIEGWDRREWWGIEDGESLFVDDWFPDGDWTVLDIGLGAGCRVRTADLVFGELSEWRTGRELFVRLEDGPVAAELLDPVRSFFRHPDEASFWDRITSDGFDATTRQVYADWLDEHGDPHAWVFREPMPFAHVYLRFDWIGASRRVGYQLIGHRRTLWEFAGLTRSRRGVEFTLSDGTPVPQFIAYLLGVARIRSEERLAGADLERLAEVVNRGEADGEPQLMLGIEHYRRQLGNVGLWLEGDLLIGPDDEVVCRLTDPVRLASQLEQALQTNPPTPTDLAALLRAASGETVQASRVDYPFLPGVPGPPLRPEADLDPLTGVGSRRAFDTVLAEVLRNRTSTTFPLSALSLDLDNFRRINHVYSMMVGDRALVEFARLVWTTLGDRGFVARTTGDGFTVLLPHAGPDAAFEVGEQVRRAVEEWSGSGDRDGEVIRLTVSVGVAEYAPGQSHHLRDVAEDAVRRAKAAGRNRVCR